MNAISQRRSLVLFAAGLALAACQPDAPKKTARLQDALPGMPLPGDPTFVSRSASENALQVVLTSGQSPEAIAAFYRAILSKTPWTLVSDQPFNGTGRVLYATRNGPPLWVTIIPNPNGIGTQISLNGAVEPASNDTAKAGQKPGATPDSGKKEKTVPKPKPGT